MLFRGADWSATAMGAGRDPVRAVLFDITRPCTSGVQPKRCAGGSLGLSHSVPAARLHGVRDRGRGGLYFSLALAG
jgi:hypothetical protein